MEKRGGVEVEDMEVIEICDSRPTSETKGTQLKKADLWQPGKADPKKTVATIEREEPTGWEKDFNDLEDTAMEMVVYITELEGWAQKDVDKKRMGKETMEELKHYIHGMQQIMRNMQRVVGRIQGRQEGRTEVMEMVRLQLKQETAQFKMEFGEIQRLKGSSGGSDGVGEWPDGCPVPHLCRPRQDDFEWSAAFFLFDGSGGGDSWGLGGEPGTHQTPRPCGHSVSRQSGRYRQSRTLL